MSDPNEDYLRGMEFRKESKYHAHGPNGECEDGKFLLIENAVFKVTWESERPCKHAKVIWDGGLEPTDSHYGAYHPRWVRLPLTVCVSTQGGYDATEVCVDCVFEAVAKLRAPPTTSGEGE